MPVSDTERAKFEAVFIVIRDELVDYIGAQGMPKDVVDWFRRVRCRISFLARLGHSLHLQSLDYNVPGGKLNRGLSVVDTVTILKGRALTSDEYFKAAVLGWCIELVRANFRISLADLLPNIKATSVLRRLRRLYGFQHHASRTALLVSLRGC